jgi:glycosyltransferase involved in cell wall biosynthesis
MNILHLQPDLNLTSGVTRVIFQLMNNASPESVHYVASFGGNALNEFKRERLRVVKFKLPGNKIFAPFHLLQIIFLCKKYHISVIHAHHRYFDLLGRAAGIILGIPVLTMVHSKVYSGRKISYKANHFVVPGENIRKHLSMYYGIPKSSITIINNFVDPSDYSTPAESELQELRRELGITKEMTVITFIGRFDREKGVDILLRAYKRLEREYSDLILLCIGEGRMLSGLLEYGENLRHIRFICPQALIVKYYAISDIIVLPSRVDPFPLVMIEAGLMNKVLLGTKVDGIEEFVNHEVDGYLVNCDKESLLDGFRALLNDAALRKRLAAASHDKVMNEYLVSRQIPKYYDLYNRMIKKDE